MATHEVSFTITGPFAGDAPLDRLGVFLDANGYTHETGPEGRLVATRGQPGASWRTSVLTELHTTVAIRDEQAPEGSLAMVYTVEITGQVLDDEELAFWEREAKAARAWMRGTHDAPMDLQPIARQQAEEAVERVRKMRMRGLFIAAAVVFVVYGGYLLLFTDK